MNAASRASQILLVGQRIRQLRKSRHLTQADLASKIGITQSDLSRMESGEYKVGLDTLFRILQVFELSMSRFFEEPADADKDIAIAAAGDAEGAGEGEASDREQLLSDFAQLSEDSRREVREFVAFKKQQAESRRLKWPEDSAEPNAAVAPLVSRSPRRLPRRDTLTVPVSADTAPTESARAEIEADTATATDGDTAGQTHDRDE
jgi:transcriptional regulator with XRE-family HTH domain